MRIQSQPVEGFVSLRAHRTSHRRIFDDGKGQQVCIFSYYYSLGFIYSTLRFVLANTVSLHEKIEQLSHRVRSLEDALSVAHKAISNERHPLLSDELLRIKNPLERDVVAEPPKVQEEEDTIENAGSL